MNVQPRTKIVFLGTPEFSVPALELLLKNNYEIVAVVTRPDEPIGRKMVLTPPPVKVLAQKHNTPVFQFSKLNIAQWQKEVPEADLFVVAAYGIIIPPKILVMPKFGALNIHPSLLPRWRGPSPIQFAILNGDKEFGVTLMKLDDLMDHGPIVANYKLQIINSKPVYQELHDKLSKEGAKLLIKILPKYLAREIKLIPQDDSKATFSKILIKEDGRIDWSWPAEKIERMARAFSPWPSAWTNWPSVKGILRLRLDQANVVSEESPVGSFGYVWQRNPNEILIKTSNGSLRITELTLEGKKTLKTEAFLRGYKEIAGATLI